MFGGSDEFVLRDIANYTTHIDDVYNITFLNSIELHFANCLKLYELGKIDEEEFNKEYSLYKSESNRVRNCLR